MHVWEWNKLLYIEANPSLEFQYLACHFTDNVKMAAVLDNLGISFFDLDLFEPGMEHLQFYYLNILQSDLS